MEANILVGQFGQVERRTLPEPIGTVEKPVAQFGPVIIVKPHGKNLGIATEVQLVLGQPSNGNGNVSYQVIGYLCKTEKGEIYVTLSKTHLVTFSK